MTIIEKTQDFLLETFHKYKGNCYDDNDFRQLSEDYNQFIYENLKELDALTPMEYKEQIEKYAIELSKGFDDKYFAYSFWHRFGGIYYCA